MNCARARMLASCFETTSQPLKAHAESCQRAPRSETPSGARGCAAAVGEGPPSDARVRARSDS
eukprot:8652079-Alexandrium_andersonii.AAC.1